MKLSVGLEWNGEEFIWVAACPGFAIQAHSLELLKQRCDLAYKYQLREGETIEEAERRLHKEMLPGGYRCEQCHATGPYPIDDTTPKRAFRILLDSCPQCQPYDEDSFRYVDMGGNELSILPGK